MGPESNINNSPNGPTNEQEQTPDRVKVRVRRLTQAAIDAIRHTNELRAAGATMSAPNTKTRVVPVRVKNPDIPRASYQPTEASGESSESVPDSIDLDNLSDEELIDLYGAPDPESAPEPADIDLSDFSDEEIIDLYDDLNPESSPEPDEIDLSVLSDEELLGYSEEDEGPIAPLIGISADFTHDKEALARDLAEQDLNAEVAELKSSKHFIQSIWKGNIAKKYYQAKYARELTEGKRSVKIEGVERSLDEIIENRGDATIERFILGVTKEYGDQYIHRAAGEDYTEDEKTTELVRPLIEKYAKELLEAGTDLEALKNDKDAKREFNNKIKELLAKHRDEGKPIDALLVNNYFEIAIQASEMARHSDGIERVMEGFKVYNAEVRDSIRTEAHRNNIDRIIDKISETKLGGFIPPEAIAAAVGSISAFGRFGLSRAARVIIPVGGIAVSAAFAGVRERNRLTEDRTRMMRDLAMGLEYEGMSEEESKSKRARYEAKIYGTCYELESAKSLTNNINKALESGDRDQILRAIAEARVRIDFSDSEQKDLIAYSSADNIGDERLKLDIAVIEAEHSLSEEDREKLKAIKELVQNQILKGGETESGEHIAGVEDADKAFNRMRAAMVMKKAGKTAAIGAASFLVSQEVIAMLSPDKIGILEKLGVGKRQNNEGASETILARVGETFRTRVFGGQQQVQTLEVHDVSSRDHKAIEDLRREGYKVDRSRTVIGHPGYETRQSTVDVTPSEAANRARIAIDAYADNGTRAADGNELRAYLVDGKMVSGMYGNSSLPDGEVLDYDELLAAGRIKACVNVDGADFILAGKIDPVTGQMTWMENGLATTTTGETMQLVGENGEKFYRSFMIFADQDVDADGVQHAIALATDPAGGTFGGTISQVVEEKFVTPREDLLTFVKEVPQTPSELFTGGIVPPIVTSRVGLGGVRPATESSPAESSPAGGEPSESAPAESPESPESPAPSESSPASPEDPEREAFVNLIEQNFLNRVGENGVRIMTTDSAGDPYFELNRDSWWNQLGPDMRAEIAGFFDSTNNANAQPFKEWLQSIGRLAP